MYSIAPHDWKRAFCTSSLTDNHLAESKQLSSIILVFTDVDIISQFFADKKWRYLANSSKIFKTKGYTLSRRIYIRVNAWAFRTF